MVRIRLGQADAPSRRETFLDGRLEVSSMRGVSGCDRTLLESLNLDLQGRILVVGAREALVALAVGKLFPSTEVHWLSLDAYEFRRGRSAWLRNSPKNVQLHLAADLPGACAHGKMDWVLLPVPHAGDAMLHGEVLRQARSVLGSSGKILAATDNARDRWLHGRILEIFGAVTIHRRSRRGVAYVARPQQDRGKRQRVFRRRFRARLLGQDLDLETRPGIFSHGELDEGTLALSECAVVRKTSRVLDLGCGSGALGIAAARVATEGYALLVDSSPRSVKAARENAAQNGAARNSLVVLACDLDAVRGGAFDLVLTNPPYFADYRIVEQFARDSFRALSEGGQLLLVTKTPERPKAIVERLFGSCEVTARRGYSVLRARKVPAEEGRSCGGMPKAST